MLVAALGAQPVERPLQAEQVVAVEAAGALAAVDMLGEGLGVLRADELRVVGRADIYQGPDDRRPVVRRHERRVVDRVPVDLPYVQVLFHLGYPVRHDPVRHPPNALRRRGVRVRQRGPVRPVD